MLKLEHPAVDPIQITQDDFLKARELPSPFASQWRSRYGTVFQTSLICQPVKVFPGVKRSFV